MNREIKKSFENIKAAAVLFQKRVKDNYIDYDKARNKAKNESEKYIDKAAAYDKMEKKSRAELIQAYQKNKNNMQQEFKKLIDVLEKNLDEYAAGKPDSNFIQMLNMYREYDIVPTYKEAQALLESAQTSMIAMRILKKYLETHQNEIDYKIEGFITTDSFENDINKLKEFADGRFFWMPAGVADDLNISGQDTVVKAVNVSFFQSTVNDFDNISGRWVESIPPYFGQMQSSYKTELINGEYMSQKKQYDFDLAATKNGKLVKLTPPQEDLSRMIPATDPMKDTAVKAEKIVQVFSDPDPFITNASRYM